MTPLEEQILKLRSEGLSYRKIKAELGCSMATISYHCAGDQKEKNANRRRDRRGQRRRFVQELKSQGACLDCKVNYPYYVMEFDHVRGAKIGELAHMVKHATLDDIKAEIAKCDLVCANCHRARTWSRLIKSGDSAMIDKLDLN